MIFNRKYLFKVFKQTCLLFLCFALVISCKKEKNGASNDSGAFQVGESYGGGIVFYIDATGVHGLIAAGSDQSISAKWGIGAYIKTNADAISVGSGQQNTSSIVNMLGAGEYAASICDNLELNGYSDWFLPSKSELNLLYQQRNLVGGFSEGYYWCSTEYSVSKAWYIYFPYGPQFYENKDSVAFVRAIRAF